MWDGSGIAERRKRSRDETNWKKNLTKAARNKVLYV